MPDLSIDVTLAPSTALSVREEPPVPVGTEEGEDIGVIPTEARHFCHKAKCILLTYAMYVKAEDTARTSCYEVVKE